MHILGYNIFDFSQPVNYADAFITIFVVCSISLCIFLLTKQSTKGK